MSRTINRGEDLFNAITFSIAGLAIVGVMLMSQISSAAFTINKSYRIVIVDESNLTKAKAEMVKLVKDMK